MPQRQFNAWRSCVESEKRQRLVVNRTVMVEVPRYLLAGATAVHRRKPPSQKTVMRWAKEYELADDSARVILWLLHCWAWPTLIPALVAELRARQRRRFKQEEKRLARVRRAAAKL
jgi:hypothetical protein